MKTSDLILEALTRDFTPAVQYVAGGRVSFWGVAEYVTADGWVGIRQVGGRLDEAPLSNVQLDFT